MKEIKRRILYLTKSRAYVTNDGGNILFGIVVERSSQRIVRRLTSITFR
jgi:hypothetical protein